jgi:hypothetical protein
MYIPIMRHLLQRPSLHFTQLHFTPHHYTCWNITSSHLNFTQLHFTTLSFGLTPFKFPTTPFHLTSLHFTSLHFLTVFATLLFLSLHPFYNCILHVCSRTDFTCSMWHSSVTNVGAQLWAASSVSSWPYLMAFTHWQTVSREEAHVPKPSFYDL